MADPVFQAIDKLPLSDVQKYDAWSASKDAKSPQDLIGALDKFPIGDTVKYDIYKLKFPDTTPAPPSLPEKQGMIDSALTDVKLGFRGSLADLEHTGANLISKVAPDTAADLERRAQENAPTAEEMAGREGIVNAALQGVGSLPLGVVKYAPAFLAKKYAPLVAGAIDAVGAADKGGVAALEAGAKGAASFFLQGKASKLPTRLGRTAGSAAAMAIPAAMESNGDMAKTGAAAILGGTMGVLSPKPIKEAVPEAIKMAKEASAAAVDDMRSVLAPGARGTAAEKTIRIARPHMAEQAMKADRAEYALRAARDHFDSQPIDTAGVAGAGKMSRAGLDFIAAIEGGDINSISPELRPHAQAIRDGFDERMAKIQEYGLLNQWVEDYFPHLWSRPDKAQQAFQMIGKRPLEGPKTFLRKRSFGTVQEGLDFAAANPEFGLELASHNPIDIALMKMREQDRLITAKEILKEMKGNNLLEFVRPGEKPPAGYKKIDDKVSSVMVRKGGMQTLVGYWYAPEDAAQVINNHLSPGLRGKKWFDGMNTVANSMNQFQLGMSAFHLGFTTTEAALSNFSLGVERAVHGLQTGDVSMVAKGAKDWLMAVPRAAEPIISRLIPGMEGRSFSNKLYEEWMKPGSHPTVAPMVELAKQAGGRLQMDPFYRTQIYRQMKRSWIEGNKLGATLKAAPALMERIARPIMEDIVPRQKMAAFSRMMEFEMERLGPNATQDAIRKAAQRTWDVIDDRMGQLVYDNLFWNNTAKHALMASVRSVGWNFGTMRTMLGGAKDFATAIQRANTGTDPWFTHRMAYMVTLPVVMGTVGAIITKLATGENPKDARDLFFPRQGGKDEYGRDKRLSLPTYMKDIWAWGRTLSSMDGKEGRKIVIGKLHPFLTSMYEMFMNEDWQGNAIRDEKSNPAQQFLQSMAYEAKNFRPIPIATIWDDLEKRSQGLPPRKDGPWQEQMLPFVGILDAPANIKKTEAERYLDAHAQDNRRGSSKDVIGQKKFERVRDLERAFRLNTDESKIRDIAQPWIDEGHFSDKDINEARERAEKHPLIRRMKNASFDTALKAYELLLPDDSIPPEIVNEIREQMMEKVYSELEKLSGVPDKSPEKLRVMRKLRDLGLLDSTPNPTTPKPPQQ
jgi:hypothetical protein